MSWMKSIPTLFPNTTNDRVEGEEWVTFDPTNHYPSLHKRLRTHGAITVGIPYMYQHTAAYPGGLTAACATNVRAFLCVADETQTSAGYYSFTIAGYFKDAVSSGTVAAGANVEVLNTGVAFIDDGTTTVQSANSAGQALDAAASNVVDLWLHESPVAIAAS